jgi:hypothetical protein
VAHVRRMFGCIGITQPGRLPEFLRLIACNRSQTFERHEPAIVQDSDHDFHRSLLHLIESEPGLIRIQAHQFQSGHILGELRDDERP